MKQDEIKKCLFCDQGVMHSGTPVFYRIKLDHMLVDVSAVRRQSGFEQMLGGGQGAAALAFHMGPQEDIADLVITKECIVCQPCMLDPKTPLALLIGE